MLLRSSSAPLILSLFPDSPSRDLDNNLANNNRFANSNENLRISLGRGSQHFSSFSNNLSGRKTFRRALSDSNLEGTSFGLEDVYSSRILMSDPLCEDETSMLHTEPSFCIYSSDDKFEPENEDSIKGKLMGNEGKLERSVTIAESIEPQFSFGMNAMRVISEDLNEEDKVDEEQEEANERASNSDRDADLEKYYDKMIREDPSNPLVLRNYAQYLESKKDFSGAEECYLRATQADPNDGEILSRYAKLAWELHGDQSRASTYFKRAIQAAPEDSNVLAAYASFLWKIDESDEEERLSDTTQLDERSIDLKEEKRPSSPPLHLAMGLGLGTDVTGFGGDYIYTHSDERISVEEYYKMMVEANPHNPLFLRNYAQILHRSKGDLQGAEEYYSRTILEDPSDGNVLSLYADLVWELHRDKDRAGSYFERAIEATPGDSNVLAAYAKFLWETESEEDGITEGDRNPILPTTATKVITC
ncbi:hypothetical protein CDL12_11706 [Handroanthus impetiginosus]|uniref:Uncharacterized protein n=1 Tax=Handroanthus impetiginosus TaxID=429701 RepID=A0A2G9HDP5_9LAMI|nr:hypothetical protein CDL12_11706 [Handroanthus impetiginosus]